MSILMPEKLFTSRSLAAVKKKV